MIGCCCGWLVCEVFVGAASDFRQTRIVLVSNRTLSRRKMSLSGHAVTRQFRKTNYVALLACINKTPQTQPPTPHITERRQTKKYHKFVVLCSTYNNIQINNLYSSTRISKNQRYHRSSLEYHSRFLSIRHDDKYYHRHTPQ